MKTRITSFDSLRGIAIIGVVFIHVNSIALNQVHHGINFYLSVLFKQMAVFSVPLFLFISGYFASYTEIRKMTDYKKMLNKQLPRVLIPFFIWSIFYSIYRYSLGADLKQIAKNFITFQASLPFYYILLIFQYYILQPLITYLARGPKGLIISLGISLFCCQLIEILRYKYQIELPIIIASNFLTWLIYPVMGAYLNKSVINFRAKPALLLAILFLILSFIHTAYLIDTYKQPNYAGTAIKVSSCLYSISLILYLFMIRDKLATNKLLVKDGLLYKIGILSFGIYFIHMFILEITGRIIEKVSRVEFRQNIIIQIFETMLVVATSYAIGVMVRTIDVDKSKKYFGF